MKSRRSNTRLTVLAVVIPMLSILLGAQLACLVPPPIQVGDGREDRRGKGDRDDRRDDRDRRDGREHREGDGRRR